MIPFPAPSQVLGFFFFLGKLSSSFIKVRSESKMAIFSALLTMLSVVARLISNQTCS